MKGNSKNLENDNPRMVRGYAILAKGNEPKEIKRNVYKIPSQSGNGDYIVRYIDGKYSCTCPDYKYRKVICKHIHAVILWKKIKEKLQKEGIEEAKPITCKFCGSSDVIKYGKKNGKQNYMCKTCHRKFVLNEGFEGMKYNPKIITLTLDLYFKGVSSRKICDHLKQFYGLKVSHVTILNWIDKYITILDNYVRKLEPELGNAWHVDEMMVNIKGKWRWLWNVMDDETRFLLASVISKERKMEDARKVFQIAKMNGGKRKPKYIITDGLHAYEKAIRKEFITKGRKTIHIRNVGIRDGLNNPIERLHGTVRERDKVMRALKKEDSKIIDGLRIYYNYIRPHMGLNGKTPAEEAGLMELNGNRWLKLIKQAVKENGMSPTPT